MGNAKTEPAIEGIAIIGMTGRFPGAKSLAEFWRNLRDGVESVSFFSDEELESSGVEPSLFRNPNYIKARAVLDDVELFDASFFGINPREAEIIDPQHRLFLECAWEALESAGYNPETYEASVGIYGGVSMNTYLLNNLQSNKALIESVGTYQTMLGNDKDFMPTRVSYKLNLRGPSVVVQTACSTSLVAVQLACQSLLNYQCDIALAGGVSIRTPRKAGYLYQEGMILSPDGHCRAFDAKAHGTIVGEGAGIVVLKRLADAVVDRDCIHAVIKGASINNDGSSKVGYTAPSVDGQAEVIAMAQAIAGVGPDTITYVEAHGTGTPLGDPIEIAALTKAFRVHTEKRRFCAVGSVKSNIGHLDAAAGVAGLIKTLLALKHRMLPPSLHFEAPNPNIDFDNSPFYVNAKLAEWNTEETPLRAGVSSFGIGGTNAHVIVEEAPAMEGSGPSRPWQLLVLSSKTSAALENITDNLIQHLKENPNLNLADVSYTLQVGRRRFSHRRIAVCRDHDDAVSVLATMDPKRVFTAVQDSHDRPVIFMFTGQGSQYVNMGLELYRIESKFREQVDHCSEILKPLIGFDLRDVLYPSEEHAQSATDKLNQTMVTQPALFVIEYALARLWIEWGIRPQAMIGHSIGEYVAACLSGIFSLEDALALVAARGQLMQKMPGGAMLAVSLPESAVHPLLDCKLSLAALNGPSLCVVSGPKHAVEGLQNQLAQRGVSCSQLHTSHAFHSEMMAPILGPFMEQVKRVTLSPPEIPFVSNVTGTWITAGEAQDPSYWTKHLRQTVRFAEGVRSLLREPDRILLEVGPGQTLSSLVRQHPGKNPGQVVLSSTRHPQDQQSDVAFLMNTLGRLWLAGSRVDWSAVYCNERRYRIPLPTYPFERQRYWVEPRKPVERSEARPLTLEKKPDIGDWFYVPSWKRSLPPRTENDFHGQDLCWLVFVNGCEIGHQLIERLKEQGQHVISVKVGEKFTRVGGALYKINPTARTDYDALIKELYGQGKIPKRIVHLWTVTPKDHIPAGMKSVEEAQERGFYSLLFLSQALDAHGATGPLQMDVISNQMHELVCETITYPEKATILGPCRVIPQEYANITCRSIDISLEPSMNLAGEKLVDQLLAELNSKASEPVIAYRGRHRWIQTFEPIRLAATNEFQARLKDRGVYLITGGLGGIGLVFAEHLAKTVKAKLVLTGRTALPARERWSGWLETHDDQDGMARKIRKIQFLEQLGAEVLAMGADVANTEEMQRVINCAIERFGGIHGVIHAAGIAVSASSIPLKTVETAADVLAPKVTGTVVLYNLLRDAKPDFFLLCSSIASMLPPPGQIDYCAANAFLDAFAQCHNSNNETHVVAVNWDTWREVGMAVDIPVPLGLKKRREENLKKGILSEEGVDALNRILSTSLPQVVVSTTDLLARFAQSVEPESLSDRLQSSETIPEEPATRHSRPNLSNNFVAPETSMQQAIAEIWQELLGIDQVGIYDNFFDLGGHSLLATQVMGQLEKKLGLHINRTELMFQTLGQLAAACEERMDQLQRSEPEGLIRKLSHAIRNTVSHRIDDRNCN